jgi:putative transposase
MTKSNKGTVEAPGKNAAQKRELNRSILWQGWGILLAMLAFKLNRKGEELVKADRKEHLSDML